ncbi:MAG TPA: TadE/TadG family type IV pilus assembly protein [Acidimicrobiales bacterium]|nr:TadE/TadG family type IV pilus assembly protein [Acidimicrobiales bacterium]
MTRLRRDDRGATAVEMAFVLPMLVLFLIGSLQVGLVVVGGSAASNAAREGARKAAIYYECADNHVSARCSATPSTNYNLIKSAVMAKLAGLVNSSTVTVSVACHADGATGAVVTCEKGYVTEGSDVVTVTVTWQHVGATPYVTRTTHTSVATSVIIGRPDLTVLAPEPDVTPASVVSMVAYDSNLDGVLDQVKVTFSEDIATTVNKAAFTIANSVTGSNAISAATVSNRVVTLTLSGSTVNTAIGSMTVALNPQSDGVVDLWGNQSSFAPTAPADGAGPVFTSLSDTNGLVNGYPNALDTLTLSFSEPIATALSATTNVTYTRPNSGSATIDITSVSAGPLTTNSTSYLLSKNTTQSVSALLSKSGNTVTVTVLSPIACNPLLCLLLGTGNDSSAWTFVPAASLADAAGNAVSGTRTISNLF